MTPLYYIALALNILFAIFAAYELIKEDNMRPMLVAIVIFLVLMYVGISYVNSIPN